MAVRISKRAAKKIFGTSPKRGGEKEHQNLLDALHYKPISWSSVHDHDMEWKVMISLPYSYAYSKNTLYQRTRIGGVSIRPAVVGLRDDLETVVAQSVKGKHVVKNKVWLDIMVEKPHHRGDAINVLDTIADAIKKGMGVDDRWFCIKRLDWSIVKYDPRIYVGIGQEDSMDA